MIKRCGNVFFLSTENTEYVFRVTETGQLEHLHYGAAVCPGDEAAMQEKRTVPAGNMISYREDSPWVTLEDLRLEVSGEGKGDIREPMLEIIHSDGSRTCDWIFEKAETVSGFPDSGGLLMPSDEDHAAEYLCVTLKDRNSDLVLELHYCVYPKEDIIGRNAVLINSSDTTVRIERFLSAQLDFFGAECTVTTFRGAWTREMDRTDVKLSGGAFWGGSPTGTSSARENPFFIVQLPEAEEDTGTCLGFNLLYSGSHCKVCEVSAYGKTRVLCGIHPRGFSWLLQPGEQFVAPLAVFTWSDRGLQGISRNMHAFIRSRIVRGPWQYRPRPVLLNSWEACYFKISEPKLLHLAECAVKAGAELFVVDDGWFGHRSDDTSSLGDWAPDRKKLPNGLDGLSKKIHGIGLKFGIWVEPEMVSTDSRFYQEHPGWTMEIPGKDHSEGRHQRILDLANPEVTDAVIERMTGLFSSARIDYVKWDMNRFFSDVYSPCLPPERQGETAHRYVLGLYRILSALTERFPSILWEGCASGGSRFDLGMLCYVQQIWASDDTDAVCRTVIQENYSYGYPQSTYSAHVSACPNHQTLRSVPLYTRFACAFFGIMGLELNLNDCSKEDMKTVSQMISLYKEWRDVLQFGDFYRGRTGRIHEWTCVSKDRKRAVGLLLQELAEANTPHTVYRAKGLDPAYRYRFSNVAQHYDLRLFGSLINTQSPFHIKQDSLLHGVVAKFVPLTGEKEEYTVSGNALMQEGVHLHENYCGTGFSGDIRIFGDFAARLYLMEAISDGERPCTTE